jgi:hypothetical protein
MDLNRFVAATTSLHRVPVATDRRLRLAAWVGLSAISTSLVVRWTLGGLVGTAMRPGFFIIGWPLVRWGIDPGGPVMGECALLCALLGGMVALATRGFSRGSRAGQLAIAAVAVELVTALPLALALFISVFDIALWSALGVLCIAVVVLFIWALLSGSST